VFLSPRALSSLSFRLVALAYQPAFERAGLLLREPHQHVLCRFSLQTPQHRRDFNPLHMPDPQRPGRADDHRGLIHEPIAQHWRPLYSQRGKICLGMG